MVTEVETEVEPVLDIEAELVVFYRTCKSPAVRLDALLALHDIREIREHVAKTAFVPPPSDGVPVIAPPLKVTGTTVRPGFRIGKHTQVSGTLLTKYGPGTFTDLQGFNEQPVIAEAGEYEFLFLDGTELCAMRAGGLKEKVCDIVGGSYLPCSVYIKE